MTRVYLVRHAEAEGNLYRRIHGQYDSLVTPNGYRQIAALEERFAPVHVDAVYASDLFRTRTTAGAIYRPKGLELHTCKGLREISMGVWEDLPWGQVARTDPERLKLFNTASPDYIVEGGETFRQLRQRMVDSILNIAQAHDGQTVAVVSHGMAIRNALAHFYGYSLEQTNQVPHCDNTGVTCLEVEGDRVRIVFQNDNAHLGEELSTFARQKWWREKEGGEADANMWFRPLDFAREEDLYRRSRREAWRAIHGSMEHYDEEAFTAVAKASAQADPKAVLVVMLGQEMVGILQMEFSRYAEEKKGYIPFYYMMPGHRRQGLGVQLLGQAVSTYRAMGRDGVRLRCAPDNEVAQRFYKRNGFCKVGEEQGSSVPLDILEKYIGYDPGHEGLSHSMTV